MTDARKLRLTLESTLDSVEAAELIVQRMAELNGFGEDEVHQIGLGVRETVANAVQHGNAFSSEKTVAFDTSVDETGFEVTVVDQGPGFEEDAVCDPLDPENLLRASGRGLLLMRAFFDKVEVGPCSSSGTKVRLVKYRTSGADGTAQEDLMSLSTSIRDVAGVTVVDLSGRITLGEASGKLRETVRSLLDTGVTKILLNLEQVSYIDSSGLGELVSAYTTARGKDCTVKLLHVQAKVQDLLTVTKLYTVFETHTDEAAAVGSF